MEFLTYFSNYPSVSHETTPRTKGRHFLIRASTFPTAIPFPSLLFPVGSFVQLHLPFFYSSVLQIQLTSRNPDLFS